MNSNARGSISKNLYCVICTKDRPLEVLRLLANIADQNLVPALVLVVDSSSNGETRSAVQDTVLCQITRVQYVPSLPGAAHQKNVGLDVITGQTSDNEDATVCFLDDDVELASTYFQAVLEAFAARPDASCIGGFDISNPPHLDTPIRRIAGLSARDAAGKILKSGIAIPPRPATDYEDVTWVPGFTQNIPLSLAREMRFDGRVRIYGDEVEFQLRLAKFGPVVCAEALGLRHLSAQGSKDTRRQFESYMDGFRWTLAERYPDRFSKLSVLSSTLALMTAECLLFLIGRRAFGKEAALGHLDFLRRLASKQNVQQFVQHAGSGPFTS